MVILQRGVETGPVLHFYLELRPNESFRTLSLILGSVQQSVVELLQAAVLRLLFGTALALLSPGSRRSCVWLVLNQVLSIWE